jgi:hypothetical protein
MSHSSVCLCEVSCALPNNEETCTTPILSLSDVVTELHSMKRLQEALVRSNEALVRSNEALAREVKALKRARPSPKDTDEEITPCEFPEVDFTDLMEFLKSKNTISVVIQRHVWPIKVKGKSLMVQESDRWKAVTDAKMYEITERIRFQLRFHLNALIKRDNMDKDVNSHLPEYSLKVMEISEADVKRAFLTE